MPTTEQVIQGLRAQVVSYQATQQACDDKIRQLKADLERERARVAELEQLLGPRPVPRSAP